MGVVKLKYKGEGRAFVADWKKIKKEYIAGNVTYMELSEKHGVSFSTLTKVARREKWRELKQKACEKTDNDVVNTVGARNAQLDEADRKSVV